MNTFFFLIPVIAKANAGNWPLVEHNLNRVLASILNQSDGRWQAIIIHQGAPELAYQDERIRLLEASFAINTDPMRGARDKYRKRKFAASQLKKEGQSGYFFGLDADDLVHQDLVGHVLNNQSGAEAFVMQSGIKADVVQRRFQLVPEGFYRRCGSCFVLALANHELPDGYKDKSSLYSRCIQGKHALHHENAQALGKKVAEIDFPSVVYAVNHQASLWSIKRQGKAQSLRVNKTESRTCGHYYARNFGQADAVVQKELWYQRLWRRLFGF